MTEISSAAVHLEPSLASAALHTPEASRANGSPTEEEADGSQIRCICGYDEDDGNTVLCENCDTWQHIECFYPGKSPDDLQEGHHFCNRCSPRFLDGKAAAERQRQSRTITPSDKKKRTTTKPRIQTINPKKKLKDSLSNGTSHPDASYTHDRASDSPHDPPPAKKAKTSHRSSASVTAISLPQPASARKRTNSVAAAQMSPTKSPSSPMVNGQFDYNLTPDFFTMYDSPYKDTSGNTYHNISFLDTLSLWLDDPNELSTVTNGKTHNDVFKTWSKPWSDLQDASPGLAKASLEDPLILVHGRHPVYECLTVKSYTPGGAFIGELNGVIGKIEDYCRESTRWDTLRHPEPFVFFHDKLPICIDARKEGSQLRFLRRSCKPNLAIQIIIVEREYRFCFVSSNEIHEGEEATIGWNLTDTGLACAQKLLQKEPFTVDEATDIIGWVTGIFSNFGACACQDRNTCLLESLRLKAVNYLNTKPPVKRKANKRSQPSPYGTGHANNSRAGSENVMQADIPEEAVGSPSATGSGRSKPPSRDITPAQPGDPSTVGLGLELSSRELKKLQQQERLFEKMESDGTKGRKRNSGGSALNTPSINASVSVTTEAYQSANTAKRQLGHSSADPSPTSLSIKQPRPNGRIEKKIRRPITNGVLKNGKPSLSRSYTESSTQTEESTNSKLSEEEQLLFERRKQQGCSPAMRLLRRVKRQRLKLQRHSSASNGYSTSPSPFPSSLSPVDGRLEGNKEMPPPPLPIHVGKIETKIESIVPPPITLSPTRAEDVEMKDADVQVIPVKQPQTPSPILDQKPFVSAQSSPQPLEPTQEPPAPPPTPATASVETATLVQPQKHAPAPPALHIPMPPPSFNKALQSPSSTPSTPGALSALTPSTVPPTTPGLSGGSPTMIQSPTAFQSVQPLQSPQLANLTVATPVKKKLSLSDYTRRKKTEAAKDTVQPSPLATSTPLTSFPSDSAKADGLDRDRDQDALSSQPPSTTQSPVLEKIEKLAGPVLNAEPTPMEVDSIPESKSAEEVPANS
jgi:uncharacterized protein